MVADLIFLHGQHRPACIASVDKRFDYYTLQLMVRGGVELFYDHHRREMRGAWLWPCFPGPRIRFHNWPVGEPWDHRYLAFAGPRVAEWEAHGLWLADAEPIEDPATVDRLAALFDEALACALRPGRWDRLRAINTLERLLLERAQLADRSPPESPHWLERVTARLTDLRADEPDYEDLARTLGMSLATLRRRFRRATGMSLHDYRLDARVTAARKLLGNTDLPIKSIAERLGYRDVYYFSRQFRQRVGVAPGVYRRSRQT